MIQLEQKFYQRSSYLFPNDCDDHDQDHENHRHHRGLVTSRFSSFDASDHTKRSFLNMIQEMASLVTDLEVAAESNDLQEQKTQPMQHQVCMVTPILPTKQKKFYQKAYSPTSCAFDLSEELSQPRGNTAKPPQIRKRQRPSALEISCLSDWRHQMFDWTCAVCHGLIGEENSGIILATTFSILDRYLSIALSKKCENDHGIDSPLRISREEFQLFVWSLCT
jgi:hypothetical protein